MTEYFQHDPTELIIVPGHAAFKESVTEVPAAPERDEYWVLQEFQQGEPPYYIEHIEAGVKRPPKIKRACCYYPVVEPGWMPDIGAKPPPISPSRNISIIGVPGR
jgi:hypothetical protein